MPERGHTHRPRILIVDDDPHIRIGLRELLEPDGFGILEAGDGKVALDLLTRERVDLVLLDLELPRISGLELLRRVVKRGLTVSVVIISGRGSIPAAVEATKLGALDFLEKPVRGDHALQVVRDAVARVMLRRGEPAPSCSPDIAGLVGRGPGVEKVRREIARVARLDAKVLLLGESGTGKELTARAIHGQGRRAQGPFVPVNCAAIPESLIESELFGVERGAFTGATSRRCGRVEQAHRGTLFLDEVGDMSLMTQARLLRVLEDRRIQRLGGDREIPVDFRLIAATHKDLVREVEQGNFREDLFYRINVLVIRLPALRERIEDIPLLVEHFFTVLAQEQPISPPLLTAPALRLLMSHGWPGNIRELRNVCERLALARADADGQIEPEGVLEVLSASLSAEDPGPLPLLKAARADFERSFILGALAAHAWKIQETADALGVNRSHLWRKMRQLEIEAA